MKFFIFFFQAKQKKFIELVSSNTINRVVEMTEEGIDPNFQDEKTGGKNYTPEAHCNNTAKPPVIVTLPHANLPHPLPQKKEKEENSSINNTATNCNKSGWRKCSHLAGSICSVIKTGKIDFVILIRMDVSRTCTVQRCCDERWLYESF